MAFKKCKFCGNDNIQFITTSDSIFEVAYQCMCNRCKNCTEKYGTKETAFNAWNKENSK